MILPLLALTLIFSSQQDNSFYTRKDNNSELKVGPQTSALSSLKPVWYRTWGGTGIEYVWYLKKDNLDNLYLVGQTYSYGAGYANIAMLKYNNDGVLQWNRTGVVVTFEMLRSVTMDSSYNIYFMGDTINSGIDEFDVSIVKYNSAGVYQWNRTWGGIESDIGNAIVSDSSNNVYIAGYTLSYGAGESDVFIVKYNNAGTLQWNRTWGGNETEMGEAITLDTSTNVYIAGTTSSYGEGKEDICLLKYSSSGALLWNHTWGGNETDLYYQLALDSSNNIYIAGRTDYQKYYDQKERVLIKFDNTGEQLWNQTTSIPGDRSETLMDIVLDSHEDVYLLGEILIDDPPRHWFNIFLEKYSNSSGTRLWDQIWNKSRRDIPYELEVDLSDNIYITGSSEINVRPGSEYFQGDMIILIYDSFGMLKSETTWGGEEGDFASEIVLDSLGNVYIAGGTMSFGEVEYDMCIVKFTATAEVIIPGYDLGLLILILSGVSIIIVISRITKTIGSFHAKRSNFSK